MVETPLEGNAERARLREVDEHLTEPPAEPAGPEPPGALPRGPHPTLGPRRPACPRGPACC